MELVEQRRQKNENQCSHLRTLEIRPIEPYGPIRKHRQDRVFGNVGALSNHVVPYLNLMR